MAMEQAQPLEYSRLAYAETDLSLPPIARDRAEEEQEIAKYEAELAQARQEKASYGKLLFLEDRLDCARDRLAVALQDEPDLFQPSAIQHLTVCGVHLLGFPGEMFVQYQN